MNPLTNTTYPRVPVNGTRLQFGASIRLSATYYSDEIDSTQIPKLLSKYVTFSNTHGLFDDGYKSPEIRKWICASLDVVTYDYYEFRFTGEFVYNPAGWDTIAVYVEPFSGQLAVVTDAAIAKVWNPGAGSVGFVQEPIADPLAGIVRYQQAPTRNLTPLFQFLEQGGTNFNTFVQNALTR